MEMYRNKLNMKKYENAWKPIKQYGNIQQCTRKYGHIWKYIENMEIYGKLLGNL